MSSEVKTEMIEFPSNGERTPGFLARPQDEAAHPGLVVIQEWWGLVPHIKDVAQRFAAQGFIALAPDLYHGQAASEPDEARKLAMELEEARAVAEIQAAMRYLQGLQAVSPSKIGVVGWCMGGHLVLSTAAESSDLGAAVAFYGRPRDVNMAAQIEAPVLGLYGEHDHGIPVDLVRQFDQALEQHGVPHEIHIYPGAGHAFFNDTRPQIYDAEAAQDAWQRTLQWFRRYLT
jgi:carboxymethylenebutenolidase